MMPDYYADMFNLYVAFAPVTRVMGDDGFLSYITQYEKELQTVIQKLGFYNIYQTGYYSREAQSDFCIAFRQLCQYFDEGYFTPGVDNEERLPVKMAHSPAGAGWRNLIHYAQIIKNKKFLRFDYGEKENMIKYGQSTPPEYKLSDIKVKMAIAHGSLDTVADPADVAWLLDQSQSGLNVKDLLLFQKEYKFGHGTYGLAQDASFLYDDFMPLIKRVTEESI